MNIGWLVPCVLALDVEVLQRKNVQAKGDAFSLEAVTEPDGALYLDSKPQPEQTHTN